MYTWELTDEVAKRLGEEDREALEGALAWGEYASKLLGGGEPINRDLDGLEALADLLGVEEPGYLIESPKSAFSAAYGKAMALVYEALSVIAAANCRYPGLAYDDFRELSGDLGMGPHDGIEDAFTRFLDALGINKYPYLYSLAPVVGLADMEEFRDHVEWWLTAAWALNEAEGRGFECVQAVLEHLTDGEAGDALDVALYGCEGGKK